MTEKTTTVEDGIAYAKEVYAACATVGFNTDLVAQLKRLLNDHELGRGDIADLVATAQKAQLASITWVSR